MFVQVQIKVFVIQPVHMLNVPAVIPANQVFVHLNPTQNALLLNTVCQVHALPVLLQHAVMLIQELLQQELTALIQQE